VTLLQKALATDAHNPPYLAELGFLFAQVYQEPAKAMQYFQQSLQEKPSNGEALFELVSAYLKENQIAQAQEFLGRLVKDHLESSAASVALADLFLQQGEQARAVQVLEMSAPKSDSPGSVYASLGALHLETANHPKAIEAYQAAVKAQEPKADRSGEAKAKLNDAKMGLARALARNGQVQESADVLKAVIEKSPDYAEAPNLLEELRAGLPQPKPTLAE
jgi:tetratricopeptide (TPR) repeat protein